MRVAGCVCVYVCFFLCLFLKKGRAACYRLLKEERRVNNEYHRRVHGMPSEWGSLVSKRLLERHPLYSPSKDKRLRRETTLTARTPPIELDDIEEMIREEVLEALLGRQELCSCGKLIETGEMFSAHVLPCPHCRKQKCSECTAAAMEVRAKSSCCESCAMACDACVRRLRLACSVCAGRFWGGFVFCPSTFFFPPFFDLVL